MHTLSFSLAASNLAESSAGTQQLGAAAAGDLEKRENIRERKIVRADFRPTHTF